MRSPSVTPGWPAKLAMRTMATRPGTAMRPFASRRRSSNGTSKRSRQERRTRTKAPGVYRSCSGAHEIAYRDSDGRLVFRVVAGGFEDAKAARADIVGKLSRGEPVRRAKLAFGDFAEAVLARWTVARAPFRSIGTTWMRISCRASETARSAKSAPMMLRDWSQRCGWASISRRSTGVFCVPAGKPAMQAGRSPASSRHWD
jgi:hypothetical protein